jgi:hypothetical protein
MSHFRLFITVIIAAFVMGCDMEEKIPPRSEFKTTGNFIYTDTIVAPGTMLRVGLIGMRTDYDLRALYSEVAYDGANVSNLVERSYATESELERCERDFTITTRSTIGTERWIFVVNDREGLVIKREIRITTL